MFTVGEVGDAVAATRRESAVVPARVVRIVIDAVVTILRPVDHPIAAHTTGDAGHLTAVVAAKIATDEVAFFERQIEIAVATVGGQSQAIWCARTVAAVVDTVVTDLASRRVRLNDAVAATLGQSAIDVAMAVLAVVEKSQVAFFVGWWCRLHGTIAAARPQGAVGPAAKGSVGAGVERGA